IKPKFTQFWSTNQWSSWVVHHYILRWFIRNIFINGKTKLNTSEEIKQAVYEIGSEVSE
ncbi:hypothetical protein L9F63_025278, partial [Diploptera punctata]